MFTVGSTVWLREVLHDQVWLRMPTTVVHDDSDVLALLVEPGAPFDYYPHPFGPHPWAPQTAWTGTTALHLYRPQLRYSVWRFFADHAPDGWYINFERPHVRGEDHVDTDDLGLDIIVSGDGTWHWKDVADPALMLANGRITDVELGQLFSAAGDMAALLASGVPRWWDTWATWRPHETAPRADYDPGTLPSRSTDT